jgi:hypothetical protein
MGIEGASLLQKSTEPKTQGIKKENAEKNTREKEKERKSAEIITITGKEKERKVETNPKSETANTEWKEKIDSSKLFKGSEEHSRLHMKRRSTNKSYQKLVITSSSSIKTHNYKAKTPPPKIHSTNSSSLHPNKSRNQLNRPSKTANQKSSLSASARAKPFNLFHSVAKICSLKQQSTQGHRQASPPLVNPIRQNLFKYNGNSVRNIHSSSSQRRAIRTLALSPNTNEVAIQKDSPTQSRNDLPTFPTQESLILKMKNQETGEESDNAIQVLNENNVSSSKNQNNCSQQAIINETNTLDSMKFHTFDHLQEHSKSQPKIPKKTDVKLIMFS